jgi:hypothetical protein
MCKAYSPTLSTHHSKSAVATHSKREVVVVKVAQSHHLECQILSSLPQNLSQCALQSCGARPTHYTAERMMVN